MAAALKDQANRKVKEQKFAEALELYEKAIATIIAEGQIDQQRELLVACASNVAVVHMKQSNWQQVVQACDRAISYLGSADTAPQRIKALFRKGKALIELGKLDDAHTALIESQSLNARSPIDYGGKEISAELERLDKLQTRRTFAERHRRLIELDEHRAARQSQALIEEAKAESAARQQSEIRAIAQRQTALSKEHARQSELAAARARNKAAAERDQWRHLVDGTTLPATLYTLLPDEIYLKIFSFVVGTKTALRRLHPVAPTPHSAIALIRRTVRVLCRLSLVCRLWQRLAGDRHLWESTCRLRWPHFSYSHLTELHTDVATDLHRCPPVDLRACFAQRSLLKRQLGPGGSVRRVDIVQFTAASAFAADAAARLFAVGAASEKGGFEIRLYSLRAVSTSATPLRTLLTAHKRDHQFPVHAIALSIPYVAAGRAGVGSVQIWNANTGDELFADRGTPLVHLANSDIAAVLIVDTRRQLVTLAAHIHTRQPISALLWSLDDGSRLVELRGPYADVAGSVFLHGYRHRVVAMETGRTRGVPVLCSWDLDRLDAADGGRVDTPCETAALSGPAQSRESDTAEGDTVDDYDNISFNVWRNFADRGFSTNGFSLRNVSATQNSEKTRTANDAASPQQRFVGCTVSGRVMAAVDRSAAVLCLYHIDSGELIRTIPIEVSKKIVSVAISSVYGTILCAYADGVAVFDLCTGEQLRWIAFYGWEVLGVIAPKGTANTGAGAGFYCVLGTPARGLYINCSLVSVDFELQ